MAAFARNCVSCQTIYSTILKPLTTSRPVIISVRHKYEKTRKWGPAVGRELYRRRILAGPEPERHRSESKLNWNYEAEVFAFGKRIGEEFEQETLKKAFTFRSYIDREELKRIELGMDTGPLTMRDNEILAHKGGVIISRYTKAVLRHSYPHFPEEGICAVHDYLLHDERLAVVARGIGTTDLMLCDDFPPAASTLSTAFKAIIGGLAEDQNEECAQGVVHDFLLPQLIGKDINEIWRIVNPMGVLADILAVRRQGPPEPRLIAKNASETIVSTYVVGIYSDKQLIAKSPGETVTIAEEMAARESLKHLFQTSDSRRQIGTAASLEGVTLNLDYQNPTLLEYTSEQSRIEAS